MQNQLFTYTPITERPRLQWPDGARIAFYVGLNVEHFEVDRPSTSIHASTEKLPRRRFGVVSRPTGTLRPSCHAEDVLGPGAPDCVYVVHAPAPWR